nr:MAG TPA: hypothetical protein [Bacteriophage sp.]
MSLLRHIPHMEEARPPGHSADKPFQQGPRRIQ